MIASQAALLAVLETGAKIALMAPFEGEGPMMWTVLDTGVTVHRARVRELLAKRAIRVVQDDLVGEAYQIAGGGWRIVTFPNPSRWPEPLRIAA